MMVFDWGKVSVVKRRHGLATAARQPRVQAKGGSGMGPTEARTQTRSTRLLLRAVVARIKFYIQKSGLH
jgi:hypothetical protein